MGHSFPMSRQGTRASNSRIKPQRLVFATDYPQDLTGATTQTGKGVSNISGYIAVIRSLEVPDADKAAMLGGTATGLLRLQVQG